MEIYQVLVKLLDGRTRCLQILSPTISGFSLKQNIYKITKIPVELLPLASGSWDISDQTLISASGDAQFPSLNLLLRLRGGKDGMESKQGSGMVTCNVVAISVVPEAIHDLSTKTETGGFKQACVESSNYLLAPVTDVVTAETKIVVSEEIALPDTTIASLNRPLNFEEFESAKELEILGMEQLKVELQAKGSKVRWYSARACCYAFHVESHTYRKSSKKAACKASDVQLRAGSADINNI